MHSLFPIWRAKGGGMIPAFRDFQGDSRCGGPSLPVFGDIHGVTGVE
jgi:hypothetical protein